MYWTAIVCHTAGRPGSPFWNSRNAHAPFRVLASVVLRSQFPLHPLGNGSEDHADCLGKYNNISHVFFSSHYLELWVCLTVARACSCAATACRNPGRQAVQAGLHEGEGTDVWGYCNTWLGSQSEEGAVWGNALHSCFLPIHPSHLGEPLKKSHYAIILLKIFLFLTLFLE